MTYAESLASFGEMIAVFVTFAGNLRSLYKVCVQCQRRVFSNAETGRLSEIDSPSPMPRLAYFRSLASLSRMLLLVVALLVAQLGIASHPLHFDGNGDGVKDGQKVELNCAFCIAGSHLQSGPQAPIIHLTKFFAATLVAAVRHVCAVRSLVTPRLTRGPPYSTTNA